jgi:hypothetical protein
MVRIPVEIRPRPMYLAWRVRRPFHSLLERLEIGRNGDPDPKTPRVLKFFAERLRPS